MGSMASMRPQFDPIPTLALPLKGREQECRREQAQIRAQMDTMTEDQHQ
jgi:hypothetical protein